MPSPRRILLAALPLAAAALAVSLRPADADACGLFMMRRTDLKTVTVPSLQVEQVLIVHDPEKEQEHFIREVVFRDARTRFGFVVPTPSLPTVGKVEKSPFEELAKKFPPEPAVPALTGLGSIGGIGFGSGGGAGEKTVTVISQERIGNFTAFVLAASDAAALHRWLTDNELTTPPNGEAWLKHYTDLGFYFVAFRYEPDPKNMRLTARTETVRISFATPLPFYPYLEPAPTEDAPTQDRVLAVWLVSPRRSVPVSTQRVGDKTRWKRPWTEARKHPDAALAELRPALASPLDALLPPGFAPGASSRPPPGRSEADDRRLVVQTFEDQKPSRAGWGDVVLVPEQPAPLDRERLARARPLMASLDEQVKP